MYRFLFASYLVAARFAAPLYGDFALDDFDVSAVTVSPEMQNQTITTLHVGDFDSQRSLEIGAVYSNSPPTGFMASNRDENSKLLVDVEYAPRPPGAVYRDVNFQLVYEFEEIDATDNGRNNAIIFKLDQFLATSANVSLRIFAKDDVSGRFSAGLQDLASNANPTQWIVPFSEFRSGVSQVPNFEKLQRLSVVIAAYPEQDSSENLQITMTLDAIRLAPVPEPSTSGLLLLGIMSLGWKSARSVL